MIENGNFASGSSSNSDLSRDQNLIEQARQMATPSNDSQPADPQPPKKGGGNLTRRAFAIGGGLVALGAIGAGAWWMFLRPDEGATQADPSNAEGQETETQTVAKSEKIDMRGETLVVGKDIQAGGWYAEGFLPTAKPWLEIKGSRNTYSLEKPTDPDAIDWWANQVIIMSLQDGDEVCANATISPVKVNSRLATSLGQIPDLRSGFYITGVDLEPGDYDITPHEVIDDIDAKTNVAMEGDLTWSGRVCGAVSLAALAQNMDMEAIQNKYTGIIVKKREEVEQLFGPLFAANMPFSCEALTGTANPSKTETDENETKTTDENKTENKDAANGEQPAANNGEQPPANNSEQPAANGENKPAETPADPNAPATETQPTEENKTAENTTATNDPAAAAKPIDQETTDSPAKKAYTLMSTQQQETLDKIIDALNSNRGFINASQKVITLEADDLVLPIMVDLSLQRKAGSNNSDQQQDENSGAPELTNSTMTDNEDASVFM